MRRGWSSRAKRSFNEAAGNSPAETHAGQWIISLSADASMRPPEFTGGNSNQEGNFTSFARTLQ